MTTLPMLSQQQIPDFMLFTARCLDACNGAPPKWRKKDPPKGPLWERTIPGAKSLIPYILEFARNDQTFELQTPEGLNVLKCRFPDSGAVKPMPDSLRVEFSYQVLDWQPASRIQYVPYPAKTVDPKGMVRSLLTTRKKWTQLTVGQAMIDPDNLLPTIKATVEGARIAWKAGSEPRARYSGGFFFRWTENTIHGIRITPDYGEFVTGSGVVDFFLPKIIWV